MHQDWTTDIAKVAIVLNVIQLLWQAISILWKKSGESVSVAWFSSSVGLEVVNVIYGWSKDDQLFIYNSIVCAVGQVLVLAALRTYKPWGKKEWVVMTVMISVMTGAIILPFKSVVQMAAQAVNLYGGADQPIELRAGRDGTGALELWAIVISGVSSSLWTTYCYAHFGIWGPALGYFGYTAYCIYMVWQWLKKSWSAKSS